MKSYSAIGKLIHKIIFTNRCIRCGSVIELKDSICEECSSLDKIRSPFCEYCGESKDDCTCKKHKNEYKQIVAPYYYDGTIVRAVHNLKDNSLTYLADNMAYEMSGVISEIYKDIKFDYINFVPLRTLHKRHRGFNQSELIANDLSKILGVECASLIKKVRYTGVQHRKSRRQRKTALFGAFDVVKDCRSAVKGKTILLIDDVKTTGSTLNECAKMLNIYDARAVYCATFAITKKEKG